VEHPAIAPALIAHGGAGGRGPAIERPERRRGMLAAVRAGAEVLRGGGSALDAVIATVRALEDHPLFNAGTGSLLTVDGTVEMDAAVMVAEPLPAGGACPADVGGPRRPARGSRAHGALSAVRLGAGAVAAVTRVRNPILLARAVMEHTPHVLMAGAGAERLARRAGFELCRPEEMVTPRARERWRATLESRMAAAAGGADTSGGDGPGRFGTVGAVALDARGVLAAATSTGGVSGKLPGRVGDSAIIGAGAFADAPGAASATGQGEAIMKAALCRDAVMLLRRGEPKTAARRAIAELAMLTGGQAGIVLVDRRGRLGFAHNAEVMDVAMFDAAGGIDYRWAEPLAGAQRRASVARG
jgi:beta-aspartyl-peptidase (threonine type)